MNTLPPVHEPPATATPSLSAVSGKPASRRWLWILLVLVVGVLVYFLWGRNAGVNPDASGQHQKSAKGSQHGKGGPNAVMPVGVADARIANVPIYLSGLGSVTPQATAIVKSRIDGQLMKIYFREGQIVKSGALLAELDTRPSQILLTQAEGQLARDSALLKAAQIDLVRYQTLLKQDSIARQQVDTQAALVKQYDGIVKTDQGALANAHLQLEYAHITAPISGRLGLRQIDPGNIVHASDANGIVIITQVQPITAIFSIPEDNIPRVMRQIQAGKILPVQAWDRDQKNLLATGKLITMDNEVDSATGTVKLKAIFPNNDYALFPNQFINIRMLLDVLPNATVIPSAAIQRGSKGNFVYVVQADKTVTVRTVIVGPTHGELNAIDKGIKPGETVVVDGVDKLREGAKVMPVRRDVADAALKPQHGQKAGMAGKHRQPASAESQRQ